MYGPPVLPLDPRRVQLKYECCPKDSKLQFSGHDVYFGHTFHVLHMYIYLLYTRGSLCLNTPFTWSYTV